MVHFSFLSPGCTNRQQYDISVAYTILSSVSLLSLLFLLGRIGIRRWKEKKADDDERQRRGRSSTSQPRQEASLRSLMEYLVSTLCVG